MGQEISRKKVNVGDGERGRERKEGSGREGLNRRGSV